MICFIIGLCSGMIVMAIVCDKAHREELNELRKKLDKYETETD